MNSKRHLLVPRPTESFSNQAPLVSIWSWRRVPCIILGLGITFFLGACEEDEDKRIASAQACLDSASPQTASSCLVEISGLTSPRAQSLRCSIRFLSQGFHGSRLTNAFEQLSEENEGKYPNGGDAMVIVLTNMAFTDKDLAENTLRECQASGSQALARMATLSLMATVLVDGVQGVDLSDVGENGLSEEDRAQFIQGLTQSVKGGTDEELGGLAVSASGLFCSNEDSEFSDTEVCENLKIAVQTKGGTAAIGSALRDALAQ